MHKNITRSIDKIHAANLKETKKKFKPFKYADIRLRNGKIFKTSFDFYGTLKNSNRYSKASWGLNSSILEIYDFKNLHF